MKVLFVLISHGILPNKSNFFSNHYKARMEDTPKENQSAHSQDVQSEEPLNICQKELFEMTNRFRYLTAEFDNYKKRMTREQASWRESAQDQVLTDFISLVDDLERAIEGLTLSSLHQEARAHFEGFALIGKEGKKLMAKYGIEEIQHTKEFDPSLQEAVLQTPSEEHASGNVISVLQKGYTRQGRLLRTAKVSVAT